MRRGQADVPASDKAARALRGKAGNCAMDNFQRTENASGRQVPSRRRRTSTDESDDDEEQGVKGQGNTAVNRFHGMFSYFQVGQING
jgi:hypothetical protein